MKILRKIIALIMLLISLCSMLCVSVENQIEVIEETSEAERLDEIKELRDYSSKTYLLSDGQYQYVIG